MTMTMILTGNPRMNWLAHLGVRILLVAWLGACLAPRVIAQTRFSFEANDYVAASAIAFSSDGRLLALASNGADVLLFDLVEEREAGVLKHAPGAKSPVGLGHLVFAPDSKTLAVGFAGDPSDRNIVLFDVEQRSARGSVALGEGMPMCSVFSTDGRRLLARVANTNRKRRSEVRVIDSADARLVKSLDHSPHGVVGATIAFSPDGKWLATAHGLSDTKGQVILWDAATLERRSTLRADGGWLELAFSPDSKLLAAGINHHRNISRALAGVRLWDVQTGKEQGWLDVYGEEQRRDQANVRLAFAPGSTLLAATCDISQSGMEQTKLWDLSTGEARVLSSDRIGNVDYNRSAAKFSPDRALLATAANFGQLGEFGVRLWETRNWTQVALLDMSSGIPPIAPLPATPPLQWAVGFITFSPDGKWLAARRMRHGHVSKQDVFLWKVPDVVAPAPKTTEN